MNLLDLQYAEMLQLRRCLHPLHNAGDLEVAAKRDHGSDNALTCMVRFQALDEAPVDLDLVQWEGMDVAQA